MKKYLIIILVLAIGILFGFLLNKINVQNCSQYTDLINRKIQESERVLKNENYTLNEIFYSSKLDTCLYAFTVQESEIYGSNKSYYIYDFFKEAIFSTRSETDFKVEIISLKNN